MTEIQNLTILQGFVKMQGKSKKILIIILGIYLIWGK
jgi:hypothetical protein